MTRRSLDEAVLVQTMRDGEFPESVRTTAERVAVVLTQSWCRQWYFVRDFLDALKAEDYPDLAVYELEYDRHPLFDSFLAFKERILGNDEVPYIRYYRKGRLVGISNFVSRAAFFENLDREPAG